MDSTSDIPREALDIRYNNSGWMPTVGLHRRNELFFQESSYSHFLLFGVMLAAAVLALLLPCEIRVGLGKFKYWVPYFIRNTFGQVITIDPQNMTLRISSRNTNEIVLWQQIVGLQLCEQKVPSDLVMSGFQLNLVWMEAGGAVRRHCLLKHSVKTFVVRLGRRYESMFVFPLIDHTQNSQLIK